MSLAVYDIRFYWDAEKGGAAKVPGVLQHFCSLPKVEGLPDNTVLVDYAPETGTAVIKLSEGEERRMFLCEIAAVRSYLDKLGQQQGKR